MPFHFHALTSLVTLKNWYTDYWWHRNTAKLMLMLTPQCLVITKRSHIINQVYVAILLPPDINGLRQ